MKCSRLRKHLIPYVEGSLPAHLRERLERHLATCGSCAQELRLVSDTVEALQQADYPAMEPAPDLRSRVMAQIAHARPRKVWWEASRLQAYSAVAAGVLLFALVGTTVWPLLTRSHQADLRHRVAQTAPAEEKAPRPEPEKGPRLDRAAQPTPAVPEDLGLLPGEKSAAPAPPMADKGVRRSESEERAAGRAFFSRADETPPAPSKRAASPRGETGYAMREAVRPSAPEAEPAPASDMAADALTAAKRAPTEVGKAAPEGHARDRAQAYLGGTQQLQDSPGVPPGVAGPAGPPTRHEKADLARGMGNIAPARDGEREEAQRASWAADEVLALERKLKEFPTSVTVLRELLTRYKEAGRAEDEYAVAERLTKLDADNARYWLARAQAAERANMPATARASYRRAVRLGLKNADLEYAQGRLKVLEKKPKK